MPGVRRLTAPSSSQWNIQSWRSGQDSGKARSFSDRHAALQWLRQFKREPLAMANLRSLVSRHSPVGGEVWRSSDDRVLEQASWLLIRGLLQVYRVAPLHGGYGNTAGAAGPPSAQAAPASAMPARASSASQASSSKASAKIVEDADTFSSQTDAAATADGLRRASAEQKALVEVCTR